MKRQLIQFEGYDGTAWAPLGGVRDGDQDTYIIAETGPSADNDDLDFYTANVQRLQIDQDGDLRFGDSINKVVMDWATGNTDIAGDLTVEGNLTINGTTTTINTATLSVDDHNIELGAVATPSDGTANGGGIILKGATDHTMLWSNANDSWDFSEHVNAASGKEFRIANTSVLNATTLGANVVTSSLTTVGVLAAGSISSSFGNIDIGTSTFTGNGSGLGSLNADNITTGTVDGARLGGNQSMAGVKTFTDTSAPVDTATGAVRLLGGMGVAGAIYAGSLNTANGAGIQQLAAGNLASGTVPNARIDGTYSNLTGTGALNAGQITSGFGNINIGTSTFTGNGSGLTNVDAETLDGIDGANFLRSDVADTMGGLLTMSHAGDEMIRMADTSSTGSPYISWYQGGTRRAYMQYADSGDVIYIANEGGNTRVNIDGGTSGLQFWDGTNTYTVWHSGNDGAGSGLSADNLDGLSSGSFLRADANDSFSGTLSGAGSINITGNITANSFSGDGSGLTGIGADDADTLDGLDSTQFVRSDQSDTIDAGTNTTLTLLSDNDGASTLNLVGPGQGTGRLYVGQSTSYGGGIEYNGDNSPATTGAGSDYITLWRRDNGTDSWTARNSYNSNNWEFRAEVTAYASDARLKDVEGNIDNAVDKIKALNGVIYTWNNKAFEKGLKTEADGRGVKEAGLLAQEVQKVLPEVVAPAPFDNDYLTIKYERMVPLLVEAIKEQQTQIEELKEMVAKLSK